MYIELFKVTIAFLYVFCALTNVTFESLKLTSAFTKSIFDLIPSSKYALVLW